MLRLFKKIFGIVTNVLMTSNQANKLFRKKMIGILNAYTTYLTMITALLFDKNKKNPLLINQMLQTEYQFPVIVFEEGFNIKLRQGHRHFLARTLQLGQILFCLHYLTQQAIDDNLLEDLREPILRFTEEANQLIRALAVVIDLQKPQKLVSDLNEEMENIENAFKKSVPVTLEALDTSKEYIYLAEFIYYLKDFRNMLLKLAQALR